MPSPPPFVEDLHLDSTKKAHQENDEALVCWLARKRPRVCLCRLRQRVYKYRVVTGVPCSFLSTLWWFCSASKPHLWTTWSGRGRVTTRTRFLREPGRKERLKTPPKKHQADDTTIPLGRDALASNFSVVKLCLKLYGLRPHWSAANLWAAAAFPKLS